MISLVEKFPDIAAQWHPTKNGSLAPQDVLYRNGRKVKVSEIKIWWKCNKANDHEWQSTIRSRTSSHNGCPFCRGLAVAKSNCLSTTHPHIAAQWNYNKNKLTPEMVVAGCNKKVWWKCDNRHEWVAIINNRCSGDNCPYCSGNKASIENCFATTYSSLVSQWNCVKNKISPYDITSHSNYRAWWKCPVAKDHEWQATVKDSVKYGKPACPFCKGKRVCESNCLQHRRPDLASQWHPTKNKITPNEIVAGSHKKAWWKCDRGHEWFAQINGRLQGNNCPVCRQSTGEKRIAQFLDDNNTKYDREVKFPTLKNTKHLEFDFVLHINATTHAIEYQGEQHYRPVFGKTNKIKNFLRTQQNDEIKREWCKNNGVVLTEIAYWQQDDTETILRKLIEKSGREV